MKQRGNSQRGFTIAELLIASTITVVIVVMLGTMFGSITKTASRASQRTDAFRDARAALQMMERDLSDLVHASPAAYFTATTGATIYADPNSATKKNHQLYVLCAVKNQPPGNPAPVAGDMCALGYYCRWETNSSGQQGRYILRRHFRDSDSVFRAFQSNGVGNYMPPTNPGNPSASLYTPSSSDDVLASYVWNLQITVYKADGTVDTTYPSVTDTLTVTDPSGSSAALPAAIEISFNAMSPEAARAIMSVSSDPKDWMDSTSPNYTRLIAPNAYEFRTRIKF